jgi:hypothetical protein
MVDDDDHELVSFTRLWYYMLQGCFTQFESPEESPSITYHPLPAAMT